MITKINLALFFLFFSLSMSAQVTGVVYRDFNGDGSRQTSAPNNEPGVAGVVINAYNSSNSLVQSVTSAGDGSYSITASLPLRLEYVIPAGLNCVNSLLDYNGFSGDGNNVRLVTTASTQNFAVNFVDQYTTNTNPKVYVPMYIMGNPLGSGTASTQAAFWSYDYNSSTSPANSVSLAQSQLGTVWGVAYSKQAKKVFTSAFIKRHSGLGPLGSGGIYMLDGTTLSKTNFYDLDANGIRTRAASGAVSYGDGTSFTIAGGTTITYLGPTDAVSGFPEGLGVIGDNVTNRLLPDNMNADAYDPAAFDQVGKAGLGDLDISDDGKFLFVMNLYSRSVVRLELDNAYNPTSVVSATSYPIPNYAVTNGVLRPFAVQYYRGKVYIGTVASGENAGTLSDLFAHVFELNDPVGSATFNTTPILSIPLNYKKGYPMQPMNSDVYKYWKPWSNNSANVHNLGEQAWSTPILSNLEFTDRGDMILDFMDRGGHQYGYNTYLNLNSTASGTAMYDVSGDVLIAGRDCNTGGWTLESNGSYNSDGTAYTSAGAGNTEGPGGGEFYYLEIPPDDYHHETSQGAAAVVHGTETGIFTLMDANAAFSGGTAQFNNYTANATNRLTLYGGADGFLSKANGLGDIEVAGDEPPIEVGNLVWNDANYDGIQTAGEVGISGVTVELFCDFDNNDIPDGAAIGSTTTDGNGYWYFNNANVIDGDCSVAGNQTGLQLNKKYLVRIGSSDWAAGVGAGDLTGMLLAASNSPTTGLSDASDNDASLISSIPTIGFTTTNKLGENNHSYDFGFHFPPPCTVAASVVSGSQSICFGEDPVAFTETTPASGNGTLSYQWQSSTTNCSSGFTDILGANGTTYDPPANLTITTYYHVMVTNDDGFTTCTATSNCITVTVNSLPTADAGSTQNLDCTTTSATIGTSAIGGNTYSWSPATGLSSTTIAQPTASPSSTTVYTVTVTGSNGCTATSTVTVNVNTTTPTADAGSTQNLDCTTTSATIGTSAIGGNTYSWSPATGLSSTTIAQPTASPSSTTVYTVTVTGSNGCTATSTVTVNVNTIAPTADAGSTQNLDCTTTSATIGTSAIGGNTYSWSPATGLSSTTIAQPTASPSSTTVYTVTVTGSNGCTATSTVTVNLNTTAPTADAGSTQNLDCTTTSATIGTSAIGGNTYSWSPATGLSSTTIAQPTASPSSTTVYTVTVTGSNGCTATSTVTVNVNTTAPTADAGSTQNLDCTTTSATIGTSAIGGNTYSWSPATGLSSTTIAQPTASPTSTTVYTVTVTGSNGCTATSTVTVNVNTTAPTADAGSTQNLDCITTSATIGTSAIGGNTYSWSPATGLSSTTIAQPTASPSSITVYTVTVTGSNGCTATSTVTVNVNTTTPTADAGSTQNLDCTTTSATIGTSAIGGNTYSWSPATGLSSTTIAQPTASPSTTTVYTVTVTGSNGCTATSTVTVNVNTTVPTADAGSTQNLDCTTTSATIGTSSIGGNTYSWSPATGLSSTTIAQPTANPITTTTYTVSVTGSNGCTATSTVTVNVNTTAPTADAGSTQNLDCTTTSATIGTSAIGGNTYSWSPATGLSSTTIAQPTASPSSTTVYTVTVTGSNGCTATSTVTVNVNTTAPTADAGSTQNIDCTTTSATIGTSAIGGNTYSWSPATGLSSTTIAQPTASPSSTTVYTVTVTGSNGCTATSTVTVDVNTTAPTVVISGNTVVCNGSTTTLTASGASTYVWSNTDITPSTTVGVGTYTVTGTASNGCTATSTVDVINQQGSIGNYVWEDLNKNGLNDELAMNGINGVAVELWKETAPASGIYAFYASTTTANDGGSNPGYYNFPICENANYQIHFPSTIGSLKLTNENSTPNTDNNSDANPISGLSPVIAIDVTGVGVSKDNMTIDAGYYSKAQLGNYVWNDLDHDGEQDANEVGVAGIAVTLYNQSNEVVSTTLTDAYGYYKFNPLDPGQYYVGFSLPANYEFTLQNTVGDLVDNDVNPITGLTGNYTLLSGDSNMSVDAGIYFVAPTTATVGNFVWYDTDKDGVQDAGEQGISGVVVTLYNSLNQVVASMLTDANGFYLFTDVTPGTYTVGFTLKPGLVFSPNNNTIDNPSNSDANLVTGITSSFIVLAGDNITYVDAGMYNVNLDFPLLGGLGDRVWYDTDQDGVQDEVETGVQGVLVTLYQSDSTTVISTTTTNAFGYYVFNALPAGQYVVGFSDLPLNYTLTTNTALDSVTNSDANPGTGKTNVINLGNGQYNMTYDAGIYNTLPTNTNSIGDYVWNDVNKNGIQEPSEIGVSGVTVTLYNASNVPISSTSTDASGYYHFPDLPNGTFYVGFSNLPTGYVFSPQGNGTASTDSDPNPANGLTTSVTLVGNTHITDLDAGINIGNTKIGLGSLGDLVWYDLNNNGLQDANELGVQEVTVTLYESDGTTVISTTTTNALGYYIFTSLEAGSYVVGFSNLPSGFVISPKDADAEGLNGELNSDVNSLTQKTDLILLGTGEDKMSVDMGIVPPTGTASLGNLVWFDLNNDGLQTSGEPGVQGVTVSLYNAINEVVSTTTTNALGEYYFVGLVPATYSVGFSNLPEGYTMALYNSDLSGINGALNSDADPVSGLTTTVTLSVGENNPNLDAGIVSTIVASVGDYVWFDADHDGLQDPSEQGVGGVLVTLYDNTNTPVASTITDVNGGYIFTNVTPGSYTIGFSNIPVGMEFTQEVGGPSDNDNSNVNPSTGLTASFTVVAGTHNPTIDAGLTTPQLCGLGNYVWIDTDKDGLQDPTESGVAGVLVRLYASDLTTILATTTTDGSGQYSFTSLPAGTYAVGFSNLPNGYTRTLIVGSINDASNSDMNADGKTNAVTLVGGEYNPNLDAGIYFGFPLPALELKATVAIIKENNLCDVNWFTREEQNTSRFEIERSVDGVNFEKVGSHLASGNTTGLTNYDFSDNIDAVSNQPILYYRIKLIDVDGKYSYSNTISVKPNENQEQGVSVYPVPFINELWISYQSLEEADVVVELTDLSGRVLTQKSMQISKGSNQIHLSDLQSLAAANYVVRIKNLTSGDVYIRKVLK